MRVSPFSANKQSFISTFMPQSGGTEIMMNKQKWVAGWGAAISVTAQNHCDYLKDETVRYVIFPTMQAQSVRLHFSNAYGKEPVTIQKTVLALRTEHEKTDPSTNTPVTFDGKRELTLAPGGSAVSDAIPFEVLPGREFAVSLYFAELTQIFTGHSNGGEYIKKYYFKGDFSETGEPPLTEYGEGGPYLFLHTIDFLTDAAENCHAVVAFGDSITARPWPDCLAHRLYDLGVRNCAVIRKAIGGGRILRDYPYRFRMHYGEAGIKRFRRDISHAGVDRVFILHGINDLIHPGRTNRFSPMSELPTAEELIRDGYEKYIEIARECGIKIYLATLLPCPRCMADDGIREQIRCEINRWIRTEAAVDGVIDFEAAVWDETDHKQIRAEYDCGDHLHPSFAGSVKMADSIPLDFVTE